MQLGGKLNINLEFIMIFGWFTFACLIINESRNIIENLVEIGIEVPEILTKVLNIYYNILEKNLMLLQKKVNSFLFLIQFNPLKSTFYIMIKKVIIINIS